VPREIRLFLMTVACAGILTSGCKQKSKEDEAPAAPPSASVVAVPEPTPPPPAETIPPPVAPPPPPVAVKAESIKACCAALHKEEGTAAAKDKGLYQTAATSCDAISKLVTAGTTKKSSALTTLRAGLKGAKLPPGCD
jgi:type IV secretory pathway VirB10-like protein